MDITHLWYLKHIQHIQCLSLSVHPPTYLCITFTVYLNMSYLKLSCEEKNRHEKIMCYWYSDSLESDEFILWSALQHHASTEAAFRLDTLLITIGLWSWWSLGSLTPLLDCLLKLLIANTQLPSPSILGGCFGDMCVRVHVWIIDCHGGFSRSLVRLIQIIKTVPLLCPIECTTIQCLLFFFSKLDLYGLACCRSLSEFYFFPTYCLQACTVSSGLQVLWLFLYHVMCMHKHKHTGSLTFALIGAHCHTQCTKPYAYFCSSTNTHTHTFTLAVEIRVSTFPCSCLFPWAHSVTQSLLFPSHCSCYLLCSHVFSCLCLSLYLNLFALFLVLLSVSVLLSFLPLAAVSLRKQWLCQWVQQSASLFLYPPPYGRSIAALSSRPCPYESLSLASINNS